MIKPNGVLTVTVDIAVPESVSVGKYELELSQGTWGRYEYRSHEKGSPKIVGEFYEGWVKAFDPSNKEVSSATHDITGDGLYESILWLAEDLEKAMEISKPKKAPAKKKTPAKKSTTKKTPAKKTTKSAPRRK